MYKIYAMDKTELPNEKDQEYNIPLKTAVSPSLQDNPQFVYSVDDGTLPSNMRSVFLTKVHLTREYTRSSLCFGGCCGQNNMKDKDRTRRNRMWVLVFFVILVTSLVVGFAVWETCRAVPQERPMEEWNMDQEVDNEPMTDRPESHLPMIVKHNEANFMFQRTPCRKICGEFSAFRFRSRCLDGFCTCDAYGYHPTTCLPNIEDCAISTNDVTYANAFLSDQRQSTYTCQRHRSGENSIHVFSTFGMWESDGIIVYLKTATGPKEMTIVLSSYQNVKWVIRADKGIDINSIVMIQTLNTGDSSVTLEGFPSTFTPEVTSIRRHTGYGDDRAGGHTVQLLQTITQEIGHITTFTGSEYADIFSLNLDDIQGHA